MEDKPLVTLIPKRKRIKTFVATSTYMPTTYTYIPDTYIPDIPTKKAQKKKKRSRLLKLVKSVFGFLWKVLAKVFEITIIAVAIIIFGVVMGIIAWLEEESSASARRNYEEEEERRKKEEEERRRREKEWLWWLEEGERQKQYYEKLWGQMQYWNYEHRKREEGRESDPNPYARYLYS